jgi:predicted metal-dependent phosphoesterase TrpH
VGATLHLPAAYVLLSPVCEGYDALTLLTLSEHGALLAWLLVMFGAFRLARRRRRRMANVRRRAAHSEGLMVGGFMLAFIGWYAIGALVPRPMAAIALGDRDELAVDVHSHTSASHDGRRGFDAESSRRWHAAAGYAAAYVTDHRSFSGAVAGERGNPRRAGDGTVLLPGLESAAARSRILVLGARESMGLEHDGEADLRRIAADTSVVVVLTTPASLARAPGLRLDAVESSDGAPRGLMFTRRLAPEIARFARSRGLARVAGSDNHGWGRTASAWTVMRIPGWRAMSPAMLDGAIRSALRHPDGIVRVVERRSTPLPRSVGAIAATPALIAWSVVTRLSMLERMSWLAWIWGATAIALLLARRRPRAGELPDGSSPPNGGASSAGRGLRFPARGRRVALHGR